MNNQLRLFLIAAISSFLLLNSCKKELVNSNQFLYSSYFELKTGKFIEYEVMEVVHDENASIQHDTSYYQLKCVIEDTFTDNAGRLAFNYVRYKRTNSTEPWMQSDLWSTTVFNNKAELVEENQRIVKLVFPVSEFTIWNANQFNTDVKLNCSYDELHLQRTINGFSFDSTLVVEQEDKRNLIEFKRKYEVYANRVGMVKKYYKDLQISNFDTLNIKSGKEIFMTLTNFGN
jgi:hypothetical protein